MQLREVSYSWARGRDALTIRMEEPVGGGGDENTLKLDRSCHSNSTDLLRTMELEVYGGWIGG